MENICSGEAQTMNVWVKKKITCFNKPILSIETNKNKYISQNLARKMSQYQKYADN